MKTTTRSIQKIIEEQVQRWQFMKTERKIDEEVISVVTISREPGSGGSILAEKLAEKLSYNIFHRELMQKMAESANISSRMLETLDEKGLSVLEDWIASLVNERHLWPDQYLKHLLKIIGTIGKHGKAVIIGRGANFIIPSGKRLSIRVISPLKVRVKNVCSDSGISPDEAERHIIRADADRKAFIRKYFNADITSPNHYDIVINTGALSIDAVVQAIYGALQTRHEL